VEPGFRLFTHLVDGAGERILNLDDVGALRKLQGGKPKLPPSAWRLGKTYVDEQSFTVPAALRSDSLRIVAGLYRDQQRLPVRAGPHLGTRGLLASVSVTRPPTRSATGVPELWVPRVPRGAKIVIDGKLDEMAWSRSGTTGELVNVRTGEPEPTSEISGSTKLLYDDEWFYVGFDVFDADLRGGFNPAQLDPQLWTKDAVELMLDPDGDGDNLDYYEIQVGPQNLVFDSEFDSYNRPKVEPNGPFGHQEWSAERGGAQRNAGRSG